MTVSITCPKCGLTSHNPRDVTEGYCGKCADWTGAFKELFIAPGSDFYDRQGHPITFARYAWLIETSARGEQPDYRRVAQDSVGLYWVSTVWLGIDNSFGFGGRGTRPIIFETMVFLAGTPKDMNMNRYSTEAEALAGHEATVAEIRVLDERAADRERVQDGYRTIVDKLKGEPDD